LNLISFCSAKINTSLEGGSTYLHTRTLQKVSPGANLICSISFIYTFIMVLVLRQTSSKRLRQIIIRPPRTLSRSLSISLPSLPLPLGVGLGVTSRQEVGSLNVAVPLLACNLKETLGTPQVQMRGYSNSTKYYSFSNPSIPLNQSAVAAAAEEQHEIIMDHPPAFTKVLIANRGEIARRIIRTCKQRGIQTVAIYSTADSKSPHVQEADEAICVGTALSSESYLDVNHVCKAIEISGAQAVHPGYGFLSENAGFASRVEKMGVKFIGPHSDAITAMGDKITSKKIAMEAGVNVIPGFDGFVTSQEDAVRVANDIGFPVMIKATSGGGGKGMRICYKDDEVREGFVLSTAEAKSFFNDERLFIEKYIEKPHHIEFQLLSGRKLSDNENGENENELEIICFPERECSIQRRNQKILEESPSTLLTEETRAEMVRQVKMLVRNVNYESAGTVEFLVDEEQNFFFLEMNTRLQVEHPVTEMVSGGVDLVHGMLDVAAGRGVPEEYLALQGSGEGLTEKERDGLSVPYSGHAIEARIYAEDPLRGFLPSTGPLIQYIEPTSISKDGPNEVRVDSGVVEGSMIEQYYDPMISKLIVHSPNSREEAIGGLQEALNRYVISGIRHNSAFLSDVLRHDAFIAGDTPTNFIPIHYPDGFTGVKLSAEEEAEAVAMAAAIGLWRADILGRPPLLSRKTEENDEVIVCVGGMFGKPYSVRGDIGEGHVVIESLSEEGAECHNVKIEPFQGEITHPIIDCVVNGRDKTIQIQPEDNTGVFGVKFEGASFDMIVMSPEEYELSRHMREPKEVDTSNLILSPMPGTLISYSVEDGESVVEGQDICVVEAMKMQNVIRSPCAGVIKKCHTEVGSSLMADEIIAEFEDVNGTMTD